MLLVYWYYGCKTYLSPSFVGGYGQYWCMVKIELWKCITELDDKQQRTAIYFLLPCNVCQSCIDIKVSPLNSEDGFKILLDKIKSLYVKDIHSLAYMAYNNLKHFIDQLKWILLII